MLLRAIAVLAITSVTTSGLAVEGGSVSDEFSFNGAAQTPHNPRMGALTDTLAGSLQFDEQWALELALGLTATQGNAGVKGEEFGSSGGLVMNIAPAVDFDPSHNFALTLAGFFSPRATLHTDSDVTVTGPKGNSVDTDVQLSSSTSTWGLSLMGGYDTDGETNFETSATLNAGLTHFSTEQRIEQIRAASGLPVRSDAIITYCQTHTCSQQLVNVLKNPSVTNLYEVSLNGSVTETFFQDTDVGLGFTWNLYSADPTEVGFFSLASIGRGSVSYGGGVPLAPVSWTVRPEVAQRIGDFTIRIWYQHSKYVGDEGHADLIGLRLQYKLTRNWRLTLTVSGQQDRDAENLPANSGTVSLMVKWKY
jgi:hypothetical protein